jgi:hypothetical protein
MKPRVLKDDGWREPNPIDHDGFHNRAVEWAVKSFNAKPIEEVLLGYFIMAAGGYATVLHCPWESPEEKYRVAASLRAMLQHPIVDAYAFITEAWAVKLDANKDDPDLKKMPRPSEHPDREDVLNIWTTLRDGSTKMTRFGVRMYPPKAPWLPVTKKPRLLERDDHFAEGGEMVGVMFNFFDSLAESEKKMKRQAAKAKREFNKRKKENSK